MRTVNLKSASHDALHATCIAVCREAGIAARWTEVFISEGNPTVAADYARKLASLACIAVQLEAAAMPYLDAPSYVARKISEELEYQRNRCDRA